MGNSNDGPAGPPDTSPNAVQEAQATNTTSEHETTSSDGDDFETDFEDMESGLANIKRCTKNPGHVNLTPVEDFNMAAMPEHFRSWKLYGMITASFSHVVKIKVGHVSIHRPDKYHLAKYRGKTVKTVGTGYAIIREETQHAKSIDCPLVNCPVTSDPHKVTPVFYVDTARHVVYDNTEAETATVEFFYDFDGAPVVSSQVLSLSVAGYRKEDRAILQCVSHDLDLFDKIDSKRRDKIAQISTLAAQPQLSARPEPKGPVAVVISHPHGCYKHVSMGELVGYSLKKVSLQGVEARSSDFPELRKTEKLRAFFTDLQRKHPNWQETGISDNDIYLSPEDCRRMDRQLRENDDSFRRMDHSLASISYTTATCPGSSGAPVMVFFENPDGSWDQGLWTAHFRGLRAGNSGHVNASGTVAISPEFSDRMKECMASLCEEKTVNLD